MSKRITITAPTVAPAIAVARYRRRKCVAFLNYLRNFEEEFENIFSQTAKHAVCLLEELTKVQIEHYDENIKMIEEALK